VNVERFPLGSAREEYYLSVCRLVPTSAFDLVVQAFNTAAELPFDRCR